MRGQDDSRSFLALIYEILVPIWPDAIPLLVYGNCFQLLCAVVLSAQCTDDQVNRVTPELFARWPDAFSMAKASTSDIEAVIHSVGFYRTKARHLTEAAKILATRHSGELPASMDGLLELPGVGRKTANLVLSACFGEPGIIVDTHVLRVAFRLGLCDQKKPEAIEARIAALAPRERWTSLSHALNRHGKNVCKARKPACVEGSGFQPCPLETICPRKGL